jgi:hypothetical protein
MKRFFIVLIMMVLFVFVSCEKKKVDPADDDKLTDDDIVVVDDETDTDTEESDDVSDDAEPEKCKVDPSILDVVEGYESYYALNIIAPINDSTSTERPAGPVYSKFKINIDGHPEIKLDPNFIFVQDNIQDNTLDIYTLGDLGNNKQYYYTFMVTALPLEWVDILRADEETKLPTVPFTQVLTLEEFTGYLRQCVIGIGSIITTEEGQFAEGNMELCYDQNKNFEFGENLRLGFNAKINTNKQDIVDLFSNVNSVDELCSCYGTDNKEIPCPEEETDDDPETDDDETNDEDPYVDPCVPTNPCTDTNKTVCTDLDEDGVAECACDLNYHLEEAACVSNTKNVACIDNPPANATSTVAQVEVTWNGTAWTTAADCAWTCDATFHLEEAACVSNTKMVDCTDNAPANATSTVAQVEVTWNGTAWPTAADCAWTCAEGYVINGTGDGCEAIAPE